MIEQALLAALEPTPRTLRWPAPCGGLVPLANASRMTTHTETTEMNFDINSIRNAAAAATSSSDDDGAAAELNLPKAIAGALVGALAVGLVYGVVGRFVAEFSYLAVLIGSVSGLLAVRLGGKPSPVAGGVAAAASLVMVLAAKVLVGAPAGASWIAYHTTMFDIIFCYLANPIAAFVAGGTGAGRGLLRRLPF